MRRLAGAAATAITLILMMAPGASAHGFSAAQVTSPIDGETYEHTPPAGGYFEHAGGIDRVDLQLTLVDRLGPEEPPGHDPCAPGSLAPVEGGGQDQLTFEVALPELPCNGEYSLTAYAWSEPHTLGGSVTTASATGGFVLAAPPAVPGRPDATYDDEDRTVTLSWDANREIDLLGYLVERSVDGGGFQVVADVTATRYLDDEIADGGGRYEYRVRAVRRGPNEGLEAVASDPSPAETVNASPVPEPEETTTTTTSTPASTTSTSQPAAPPPSRSVDLSSFGSLQEQSRRPVQASPRVTVDTGFEPTLPFDVPLPTEPPPETTTTTVAPRDDVAFIEYTVEQERDAKAVLAPAAGALALVVGSLQMRYLLKQAAETG